MCLKVSGCVRVGLCSISAIAGHVARQITVTTTVKFVRLAGVKVAFSYSVENMAVVTGLDALSTSVCSGFRLPMFRTQSVHVRNAFMIMTVMMLVMLVVLNVGTFLYGCAVMSSIAFEMSTAMLPMVGSFYCPSSFLGMVSHSVQAMYAVRFYVRFVVGTVRRAGLLFAVTRNALFSVSVRFVSLWCSGLCCMAM